MTKPRDATAHILVILDRLCQDGATTSLLALREGMRAEGITVDVVALRADGNTAADDLQASIVLADGGRLRSARVSTVLDLLRRARRADVIESHREYGEGLVSAYLLGVLARRRTVQLLHWDMGVHLADASPRALGVTRWIYRRLSAIICVSPVLVRSVLDLGVDPRRIFVVNNGVRVHAIRDLAAQPSTVVPELPYVLGLGRLVPRKRFDLLLSGHAQARNSGSRHVLVIAGEGSEAGALRSTAQELGVAESVIFAGPLRNPFPLLAGARALCMTSDSEADSMAVLEAAALGVRVIARDGTLDSPGLAARGISVTVVRPDDPAALGSAIVDAVRGYGQPREVPKSDGYDAARMAADHVRVLEQLSVPTLFRRSLRALA